MHLYVSLRSFLHCRSVARYALTLRRKNLSGILHKYALADLSLGSYKQISIWFFESVLPDGCSILIGLLLLKCTVVRLGFFR